MTSHPVPFMQEFYGILQARMLEWIAISFSNSLKTPTQILG